MLKVIWMCLATLLAPALAHADMDDMGASDMNDMGLVDMAGDMQDMPTAEDMSGDLGDLGMDLDTSDMPDIPAPMFTVEGMVTLEDAASFSGALVRLSAGELEFQTTTNSAGSFSIPDVPRGFYDLEVSSEGYIAQRQRINLQGLITLEIQLLLFAESAVVVEVVSPFSTMDLELSGPETLETTLSSEAGVAVWEGTLERGLWNGTLVAGGVTRQFQIDVGKNSEPIAMRVFLNESPEPGIQTETSLGCATGASGPLWFSLLVLVGFVRRRWDS